MTGRCLCFVLTAWFWVFAGYGAVAQPEQVYEFDIEATTADQSLKAIAQQTATPLLVSFKLVGSVRTNALKGAYSVREALDRLLDGTGLSGTIDRNGVITVHQSPKKHRETSVTTPKRKASLLSAVSGAILALLGSTASAQDQDAAEDNDEALDEITIVGTQQERYNFSSTTIGRLDSDILTTPRSIVVIPEQLLLDQHINTISDALANVAGVTQADGLGGTKPDNIVRGFIIDTYLRNGVRVQLQHQPSPQNIDSVELLKGPVSVFYGQSDTGGITVVGRVLRLGRLLESRINAKLKPFGLIYTDFDLLVTLRRMILALDGETGLG